MNVKSMLSRVLTANRTGLVAFHSVWLLLSITFQQKRLDKMPCTS